MTYLQFDHLMGVLMDFTITMVDILFQRKSQVKQTTSAYCSIQIAWYHTEDLRFITTAIAVETVRTFSLNKSKAKNRKKGRRATLYLIDISSNF